jgi:hypothetical protein
MANGHPIFKQCQSAEEAKIFLDDLSNSGSAVRLWSEGRQATRLKTVTGEIMTQYLIAIHR